MPDPDAAAALGVPREAITPDGALLSPAAIFLQELLTTQVVHKDGITRELREPFAALESTEGYLVPTSARWEIILMMRAEGHPLRQIAAAVQIPCVELIQWFHTDGIVRDLWLLLEAEEWENLKILMRNRAQKLLSDDKASATEAVNVARTVFETLRQGPDMAHGTDDPVAALKVVMRDAMPLPKG
jgi:hypothetical protein